MPRRSRAAAKITPEQLKAIEEELKLLPDLVKTNYTKWTNGAKDFQLQCIGAQKLGKDVLLHASTGAGKTGIAAGPHLLPSSKGKVATFRDEFGLKAVAINSSNGGCTKKIMAEVVAGEWQIVMLAPEMLLSRRFIDGVLRKSAFGSRCLSVFIDEAHCVSHWGDSFRKKYASIGIVRAFLPRATPIVAVTATLTPRVHQDLLVKLQFNPKDYLFCSIGNDRENVSQVIRSMEHPANSYMDLDFLVDEAMTPAEIKKAFLYTDDIKDGSQIIDHLNARVNPAYRDMGLVRPYNAGMSREYRMQVMALFKAGIIRVLVCTDAAGMGCDIADIAIVIQWKAPKNLSSWVQRAGRAVRKAGVYGMAVMIVEKSAFEVNPLDGTTPTAEAAPAAAPPTRGGKRGRGRGRGRGGGGRGGVKQGKDYAVRHGQKRGSYRGTDDAMTALEVLDVPEDAPAEGLYALIQATTCRRRILCRIFRNEKLPDVPKERCCDICNPKLFDTVRPPKPVRAVRQKGIRKGEPVDSVRQSLYVWRRNILKMHYRGRLFAAHAILDDATCELLASIGPVEAIETLEQLLQSSWSLWSELGTRLYAYMHGLEIPALPKAPPRQKQSQPTSEASVAPPASLPATAVSHPVPPHAGKRAHPVHSTPADMSAPPAKHPRTASPVASTSNLQSHTPHTPVFPRPKPRPIHAGSRRPTSSPLPTPLPHTPLPSSIPPGHMYPPNPATPYYPAYYSQYPQFPSPSQYYYSPHPQYLPTYPSQSSLPSGTPSSLRHNPYLALYTPSLPPATPSPATNRESPSSVPPQLPNPDTDPP
ncbi:P-loop containing nucleoside triphosphate hydrolase protein [Mycena polygramma]|nr:P-loop containing nucleoside triphosphate hydrolase protein [Mycena polygramma]